MDIATKVNGIQSKDDFIDFLESLINDLKNHPENWTNNTLPEFIEAFASWTEDMEGYYINNNIQMPININWKVIADILTAARSYE
ncbi:MAG: hypothetical protein EOP52_09690 [Sphingobacteriales bacterium]|nr:MAG: hypothetical protein EOP52_09690 [Sphingobacteriales bacterium]